MKWTVRQAIRTFELLTRRGLNVKVYYDLANKFITRKKGEGVIPATHRELLRVTDSSREFGKPSTFAPCPEVAAVVRAHLESAGRATPKRPGDGHRRHLTAIVSPASMGAADPTGREVG